MNQKEVERLLKNMIKGADELVAEAESDFTREHKERSYEDLQYYKGYRHGIAKVLSTLKAYYFAEDVLKSEAKKQINALYGAICYRDTDSVREEAEE